MLYGAGMLDCGMTMSFGQYVADNEAIRMVRRILEGVPTDDVSLAVDVINDVGVGGEYISHPHTFNLVRDKKAMFIPDLINKENFTNWEAMGKKTMAQDCDERALHILETYKPEPLACKDKLAQLIYDAEKEYHLGRFKK